MKTLNPLVSFLLLFIENSLHHRVTTGAVSRLLCCSTNVFYHTEYSSIMGTTATGAVASLLRRIGPEKEEASSSTLGRGQD